MKLNLRNPLVIFDLETTGINIAKDRIVEISMCKIKVNGEKEVYTKKINPTIPIPIETSLIHGIYDEDVKDAPTFKEEAKNIAKFIEGCDLGGFNVLKFDLPLLVEEFLRVEMNINVSKRKIVDAQRIFHMMEPRNLSAAYSFYCGKTLENAHSTEADTLATVAVLESQVEMYQDKVMKDKNGKEYVPIKNDINSLHELSSFKMVDWAGRMIYNDKGDIVFNFGKYRHQKVLDILKKDTSYYDWMMRGDFPLDTKQKLTEIKLSTLSLGN